MARTPGPVWTEINNDLVGADSFVFLKDAAKAALLIWAIRYPSGNLPLLKQLARDLAKDGPKAFALLGNLKGAGFVSTSPNGSLALVSGWARAHKTSASRVAKFRERTAAHCNVTMSDTEAVSETSIVTLQSEQSNVSGNVSETPPEFQKEIPLRNPLRKTTNSKDEFVDARERADPTKLPVGGRWNWPEGAEVPEAWRERAAKELERLGHPEIDMRAVCLDFSGHYCSDPNPKTYTEWQQKFFKWIRNEKRKWRTTNGARNRSEQLEQLARIIERDSDAEVLSH